jgi:glutamate carboxypeptidase
LKSFLNLDSGTDDGPGLAKVQEVLTQRLAHQLLQLENLGDPKKGTTVNWTIVRAAEKINVIPDAAEATADMRLSDVSEFVRVQNDGEAIVKNKPHPGD